MGLVTMKERAIGLDLIRAIAIVSVVCGHFFQLIHHSTMYLLWDYP